MRLQGKTVAAFVAVVLSLALPLSATANPGLVVVSELHFGEVELNTPFTLNVEFYNDWYEDLTIKHIDMSVESSPDFTFTMPSNFPGTIPPYQSIYVQITYTPTALGPAEGTLVIDWYNGGPGGSTIELDGTGVEPPGGPVTIEDVLEFFDNGVDEGTIEGRGHRPGQKKAHLKIFQVRLVLAALFIEKGWMNGACKLLERCHAFSDGEIGPRDLIEGEDVDDLNIMIQDLMAELGCQ